MSGQVSETVQAGKRLCSTEGLSGDSVAQQQVPQEPYRTNAAKDGLGSATTRKLNDLFKPGERVERATSGALGRDVAADFGKHAATTLVAAERLNFQTAGRIFEGHRNGRVYGAGVFAFGFAVTDSHKTFESLVGRIVRDFGQLKGRCLHRFNLKESTVTARRIFVFVCSDSVTPTDALRFQKKLTRCG
tara:strand:+ start:495 stop:1061 length:567 start_codon:yes stop_codon:yes gene_type:complete